MDVLYPLLAKRGGAQGPDWSSHSLEEHSKIEADLEQVREGAAMGVGWGLLAGGGGATGMGCGRHRLLEVQGVQASGAPHSARHPLPTACLPAGAGEAQGACVGWGGVQGRGWQVAASCGLAPLPCAYHRPPAPCFSLCRRARTP